MTGLLCSAIVAGVFCLQPPIGSTTDLKLEDQGIWMADSIHAPDWTLSWGVSTEHAPPKLDSAKAQQACDQGVCLHYWRHCDDAAHPAKCGYAVDVGNTFFELTVTGADGLKHAQAAVSIVTDIKAGTAIPLSKLDQDGRGDSAPLLPYTP